MTNPLFGRSKEKNRENEFSLMPSCLLGRPNLRLPKHYDQLRKIGCRDNKSSSRGDSKIGKEQDPSEGKITNNLVPWLKKKKAKKKKTVLLKVKI